MKHSQIMAMQQSSKRCPLIVVPYIHYMLPEKRAPDSINKLRKYINSKYLSQEESNFVNLLFRIVINSICIYTLYFIDMIM